jgi:quercetin dioxygenase-like cupin family protein
LEPVEKALLQSKLPPSRRPFTAMPKCKTAPEIDCNRTEDGIFKNQKPNRLPCDPIHTNGRGVSMKIADYRKVPATAPLPGVTKRVLIGPDDGAQNFIMRVFDIAPGHTSPDHAHFWEHEIFVLSGKGVVRDTGGAEAPVGEGTTVFIPGGENHCLINRGEDPLRFICIIPTGAE